MDTVCPLLTVIVPALIGITVAYVDDTPGKPANQIHYPFDRALSTDGRCGPYFEWKLCPPGNCCSKYGWCGNTALYCLWCSDPEPDCPYLAPEVNYTKPAPYPATGSSDRANIGGVADNTDQQQSDRIGSGPSPVSRSGSVSGVASDSSSPINSGLISSPIPGSVSGPAPAPGPPPALTSGSAPEPDRCVNVVTDRTNEDHADVGGPDLLDDDDYLDSVKQVNSSSSLSSFSVLMVAIPFALFMTL